MGKGDDEMHFIPAAAEILESPSVVVMGALIYANTKLESPFFCLGPFSISLSCTSTDMTAKFTLSV